MNVCNVHLFIKGGDRKEGIGRRGGKEKEWREGTERRERTGVEEGTGKDVLLKDT